ncbi:MAG: biotin/lipoyl-binding protein [Chthoniobacteraceae bacterium]
MNDQKAPNNPTAESGSPNPAPAKIKPADEPAPKPVAMSRGGEPVTRKALGRILSLAIVFGAVVLIFYVWGVIERHPRTDDATARANVVGIVPQVRGRIVKLNVQDNQEVKEGDLLFEIDPEDYQLALQKARSALDSLDQQIEVARAQDDELKFAVKAAEAQLERANAQLKQSDDTLHRLEPLLPQGFATAEQVEQAQTAKLVASSAAAMEVQHLNQARTALSVMQTLTAERPGASSAVKLAEVDLSRCKVTAPFPGRIISLNISAGAYASAGVPVFSLLDTRHWYVMANFREAEIRRMAPGTNAEAYLLSAPDRRFYGKVQGVGWAVEPEGEIDIPHSLPYVKRELNWVHIAQRFPVRIEITDPDPGLFRMGASAVVIIKGEDSR